VIGVVAKVGSNILLQAVLVEQRRDMVYRFLPPGPVQLNFRNVLLQIEETIRQWRSGRCFVYRIHLCKLVLSQFNFGGIVFIFRAKIDKKNL